MAERSTLHSILPGKQQKWIEDRFHLTVVLFSWQGRDRCRLVTKPALGLPLSEFIFVHTVEEVQSGSLLAVAQSFHKPQGTSLRAFNYSTHSSCLWAHSIPLCLTPKETQTLPKVPQTLCLNHLWLHVLFCSPASGKAARTHCVPCPSLPSPGAAM